MWNTINDDSLKETLAILLFFIVTRPPAYTNRMIQVVDDLYIDLEKHHQTTLQITHIVFVLISKEDYNQKRIIRLECNGYWFFVRVKVTDLPFSIKGEGLVCVCIILSIIIRFQASIAYDSEVISLILKCQNDITKNYRFA